MMRYGTGLGATSLILMFSVLCLAIFALLSLSVANRDRSYTEKLADSVTGYYAADSRAVVISDALSQAALAGENPPETEGIEISTDGAGQYSFLIPIDERRALAVGIELKNGETAVLFWSVTEPVNWSPDGGLNVWRGD